jgi:DNA-binding transcriptional ArsR family regulator
MFHALSDKTRLRILELIKLDEKCVSDISSHFKITQPSISHHLDILKRAGLVVSEKRGREVYYKMNRKAIIECCGVQFKTFDLTIKLK